MWYEHPSIYGSPYSPQWSRWESSLSISHFLSVKFVWEQNRKERLTFFSSCCYFPVGLLGLKMCIFALDVFLGVLLVLVPCRCLGCPPGCECFAVTHTVKCVSRSLLRVPPNIPGHARTVVITGNNIHQIGADSFTEPENVTNIILSNNRWECQCCLFLGYAYEPRLTLLMYT